MSVYANGGPLAVRIPKESSFEKNHVSVQPMNGGLLLLSAGRKPLPQEFFVRCDELVDADERVDISSVRWRSRSQKRERFVK